MVNPVGGASAVAGNQPNPNQQAAEDFNQAAGLLNKGEYAGAYELFSQILDSKNTDFIKQNPSIYYYTGLAADYSSHPEQAIKNFNTYIKLPNADATLVKSAKVQIDLMAASAAMSAKDPDYAGALASYQDAIKLDPSLHKDLQSTVSQLQGQIDLDNANQAQQQNDVTGMLKWYSQAALDDPELKSQLAPTINQLQGQLNFQNNIYPQVNAKIQEAYSLNQPSPGQVPDTAGAIRVLQGILTEYPNLSDYCDPSMIYAPLAQFEAQAVANPPVVDGNQFEGHPEEAVQILQSALQEHPGILQQDPSVYYRMAQYAWAAGHIDQARGFMQSFAPYQSQYQQAFQDPTGPSEFAQQLSGSKSAVMENFQTYAANWIANHIHAGSSEWWQNNILGALGGVMPHVDGINAYHSFGKRPLIYQRKTTAESDALRRIESERSRLYKERAHLDNPQNLAHNQAQLDALEQEESEIKAAREGKFTPATDAESRSSGKNFFDTHTVTKTTDSPSSEEEERALQAKGLGSENDPMAPNYWGMGQTLDMAAATYKTVGEVSAANPYQFDDMQLSGQTNLLNAEARTYNMVYAGGSQVGFGVTAMRGAEARADLFDESYAANFQSNPDTIGGQQLTLVNGGLSEYTSIGAQAAGHGGISAGTGGLGLSGAGSVFAGTQASAQSSLSFAGQGGYAMAQAWAGVGAKIHADASLSWKQGLHLDFGAGAALGVGGYAQVAVNLNLYAAGQDLVAATSSPTGLLKLVGDTETDAIANAPQLAITYAVGKGMVKLGKTLAKKAAQQFGKDAAEEAGKQAVKRTAQEVAEEAGDETIEMATVSTGAGTVDGASTATTAAAAASEEAATTGSGAAAAAVSTAEAGASAGAAAAAGTTTATAAAEGGALATLGAVEAGEAAAGPVGWIAAGVTAAASGIYELATNIKKVGDAFKKAWGWFKGLF